MQLKVSELRLSSYFYSKLHRLSEKHCNLRMPGCCLDIIINGVCFSKSEYVNLRTNNSLESLSALLGIVVILVCLRGYARVLSCAWSEYRLAN